MMKKRSVAILAVGAAIALIAAGCSGSSNADSDSGTVSSTDGNPTTMVMYGSSGTIEDAMVNDLLPQFEKENNVKVSYVGMPASQALLRSQSMRSAPEASLVIANELVAQSGADQGLWKELDLANMPTLETMPDILIADGTAANTGEWTVGIAYNNEEYKKNNLTPPTDWADLCDPAVSGRVVQYDIGWGYTAPFMYAWNKDLGGSIDDFSPVLKEVEACKGNFQSIAPAAADFDQAFSTGTAWIGMQASMRGAIAQAAGVPVTMVYPDSGVPRMLTPGMVPENAPAAELGEKLLDFLLTPESQAIYAGTQFYVPVNPDTELPADITDALPDLESLNLVNIDWLDLQEALPGLTSEWQQKILG